MKDPKVLILIGGDEISQTLPNYVVVDKNNFKRFEEIYLRIKEGLNVTGEKPFSSIVLQGIVILSKELIEDDWMEIMRYFGKYSVDPYVLTKTTIQDIK